MLIKTNNITHIKALMLSFHQAVVDDFTTVNQLITDQINSDVALVENIGSYLSKAMSRTSLYYTPLSALSCHCYWHIEPTPPMSAGGKAENYGVLWSTIAVT